MMYKYFAQNVEQQRFRVISCNLLYYRIREINIANDVVRIIKMGHELYFIYSSLHSTRHSY